MAARIWRKHFNRPLKTNYRMGGIGIFRLFPPTKRADLYPSIHTALSVLGGFEQAGVTVHDKQDAVEGAWSNVGLNLYFDFGVREHDMERS